MAKKYELGSGTGRGGWRGGGRPKGSKTDKTERICLAVTPEEKEYLKKCLEDFRNRNT